MKASKMCLQCLKDLSILTLQLSVESKSGLKNNKKQLKKSIIEHLESNFSTKDVPASIFSGINRQIKKLTGVNDAFSLRKAKEIEISRQIAAKIQKKYKNNLTELLVFSVIGNSLDFFKDINKSARQMQKKITLSGNSTAEFRKRLKDSKNLLFFDIDG